MAKLLKIIMINGHMPGVVELDLDGHTNVCGSNASGKTTLQRMVPVFYGELPNKVVPRTRDNFDKYYLPYKNSYVIYAYERPTQGPAHVVLTKRTDGVDYRFVDAAYEPQWYLQQTKQGAVAREYSDWMSQLKQAGIETSHKISAVSEYRSIILNDVKSQRSQRAEHLRAKKLAAKFALAPNGFALRHIEKLVSAVHAKEGKMDTLKSMLAAILEEDGFKRPENTFTRAKIQDWLMNMRHYMKVEELQAQLQQLQRLNAERVDTNENLWHLKGALETDYQQMQTQQADLEARLQEWRRERDAAEQNYETQRRTLLDNKQEAEAELDSVARQLDEVQAKYDRYRDEDMDAWGRALAKLPEQRDELQDLERHFRLLMDKHEDAQNQLAAEQLKLQERLDKSRSQLQAKKDAEQAALTQLNEAYSDAVEQRRKQLQQQKEGLQQSFGPQLQETRELLANQKAQAKNSGPSAEEQEAAQLADARIETALDELEQAQSAVDYARKHLQAAQHGRLTVSDKVSQARRDEAQANDDLETLRQRLQPLAGSLRQFLADHVEHWQHTFGKVLAEPLLQRTDLLPHQTSAQDKTIFGVQLDLQALELPEHAATEEHLQELVKQAEADLAQALKTRKNAESELQKANDAVVQAEHAEAEVQQKLKSCKHELGYARDHKARLAHQHKSAQQARKTQAEQQVKKLEQQLQQLEQQLQQQLSELDNEAQAIELEHKAEHQEAQQQHRDAIAEYEQEQQRKIMQAREQKRDLEQAFNAQLAADGVDEGKLKRTKEAMAELQEQIQLAEQQREPFRNYESFMANEWKRQRPKWQSQEQEARQAVRESENALQNLQSAYQQQRDDVKARIKQAESQRSQQQEQLRELKSMVERLLALPVALRPSTLMSDAVGDVSERLARARELMEQAQKVEKELQQQLTHFEGELYRDVDREFSQFIETSLAELGEAPELSAEVNALADVLSIIEGRQEQTINRGVTIGKGLVDVFTVFNDIHKRVNDFSRRLTQEVSDDLPLDAIQKAEVRISSTIDELGFWAPLKAMTKYYKQWRQSGELLPSQAYLDELAQVAELIRSDQDYSIESLLRLELHIQEKGQAMVIRNDRQLLESSSHGMAYLILVKFLLAFTRLLRPTEAGVVLHWPVDEIGTLAYHNVEKLFTACDHNDIYIVGAFPNPESDVLLLFDHRYLIEPHHEQPNRGQLKRIKPRMSPLAEKLAQLSKAEAQL